MSCSVFSDYIAVVNVFEAGGILWSNKVTCSLLFMACAGVTHRRQCVISYRINITIIICVNQFQESTTFTLPVPLSMLPFPTHF